MKNPNTSYSKLHQRSGILAKSLLATAIALTVNSGITIADEEADLFLEEIVVTARKRTESMQDVPVAVTAIPQSIVSDGNLDAMEEFLEMVPNVALPQDGWTSSDISIRGSGRLSGDEDPGVGINRDGVYIGGLLTSFSNFYDVESFEVLRGPQAGLYGRNAVGGAINISSARPSFDEHNGYIEAQLGSKERQEYRVASNVTLIDDVLAVRLSGLYLDQNEGFGYVENQDQYLDAGTNESARLKILYTPTDNLEFLTTIETFSTEGGLSVAAHAPRAAMGNLNGVGPVAGTDVDDTDNLQRNFRQINTSDQLQFIQEINWDVVGGTLTAIFSYRDTEAETLVDNDRTSIDLRRHHMDSNQESTFAEIRWAGDIGDVNLMIGATALEENLSLGINSLLGGEFGIDFESWYSSGLIGPEAVFLGIPNFLVGTSLANLGLTSTLGDGGGWGGPLGDQFPAEWKNDQQLSSLALFLEASYQVTDKLDVWFNVRYTEDTKEIDFSQGFQASCPIACEEVFNALGMSATVALQAEESWDNVSPSVGVNYAINEDVMVYAKYVTGFKAGGFNRIASTVERVPFDSETTDAVELGLKSQWWDNRVQVNAATFYQVREDALVLMQDPGMAINDLGVNAGEITVKGLELELQALPLEGLNVSLSLGYLDTEFEEFEIFGQDLSGNTTPVNFKYSLTSVVSYNYPLNDTMDLFTFMSYYTARDGYLAAENVNKMDEPETLDLRFGIKTDDWKISAYVDNALDQRYIASEQDPATSVTHWGIFAPGRTFGIQGAYNF
ncbi:TonB-dependent receptor [Pseudomaricurvus alkylphenolicus]|uniref:TonB-dependent receptor n=1 Tax=Pseudomaricurvus alkylphenolicus TaxID=1306991 RepID=UPI00141EF3D9|nr:TonB-dependent receptor [Pseudomaricurvus alkylphenolicus]NIB38471.1 TonB-dependent receptor [Pseudomaricurvus alkylphenolicus]